MAWVLEFERRLGRFEFLVATLCVVVIVVSVAIAVVSRSVFSSPVIWTGELSLLGQVWLTFIGASAVYKERGHVGMTGLIQALPPRVSGVLSALRDAALAVLVIFVCYSVASLMERQWQQSLSTLGLPRALTSLPVVWAMASIALSAALSVWTDIKAAVAAEGAP